MQLHGTYLCFSISSVFSVSVIFNRSRSNELLLKNSLIVRNDYMSHYYQGPSTLTSVLILLI